MTQETAGIGLLLDALASEQMTLQAELRDLAPDDWFRPTPSRYWDVRDTIAHLADIDEVAIDTCIGGPPPLNDFAARAPAPRGPNPLGGFGGGPPARRGGGPLGGGDPARGRGGAAGPGPPARGPGG